MWGFRGDLIVCANLFRDGERTEEISRRNEGIEMRERLLLENWGKLGRFSLFVLT